VLSHGEFGPTLAVGIEDTTRSGSAPMCPMSDASMPERTAGGLHARGALQVQKGALHLGMAAVLPERAVGAHDAVCGHHE
jgi:hypothetical protein